MSGKDNFLATLQNNIELVLSRVDDKDLSEIEKRLGELQTQLLKLASTKADYEDVTEDIYKLREQKQKILVENANRDELRKRITDMTSFLKKQPTAITEYDEPLVRRLIVDLLINLSKKFQIKLS